MTEQTKQFIELSDVIALRFECSDCHSFIAIPLTQFKNFPRHCPNACGKQWEQTHNRAVHVAFDNLVEAMKIVEQAATVVGLKFSLEIARREASEKEQ